MKSRQGPPEQRVYLIDEHALHRSGIKQLLGSKERFLVVGEASTFHDAARELAALTAEIVLLELGLDTAAGLSFLTQLRERSLVVLVLTLHDDPQLAQQVFNAGAAGFISKSASVELILEALHAVADNKTFAWPEPKRQATKAQSHSAEGLLSKRELQILDLIGQGQTTQRIAHQLDVSVSSVETYRDRLKAKLKLTSGAELTRYAILRGVAGTLGKTT